ncbi:efflux RND transporter permease subunit [Halorarius halobius]|uniref:efflux RND transporter permease subunit n=1 Tax=Halorarius halobius TaxID=2962671 RepID=UPI0020CBDF86|nr:MMPL family transporter [Halorarius halobius]
MAAPSAADRVTALVVGRPHLVVVAFLLATLPFVVGLTTVSTETGTDQFAEELPEQDALEAADREFTPPFEPAAGTTQLIQRGDNVLSRAALVRMLRVQQALAARPELRVDSSTSAAAQVARELDPAATTPAAQLRAVERAPPAAIDRAVRRAAAAPGFARLLSTDFSATAARASATVAVVDHRVPAAGEADDPLGPIQRRMVTLVAPIAPDVTVFGGGVLEAEFGAVIGDTLLVVVPASGLLITLFLVVAYRDPLDLLLGLVGLVLVAVWTFGLLGLAGIPFDQILVAVPPLLLAVGIDYGIHAVNRYREERSGGRAPRPAMRVTVAQLVVAFGIVTVTSVIGFASNLTSDLVPIRRFGLVAAVGIAFTALVFGVFLPAAKLLADDVRARRGLPAATTRPIGQTGSGVGRLLSVGVVAARRGPRLVLALALVTTLLAGGYATGVDTEFSQEDFLPPAETPPYLAALPEPFRPGEYTVTRTLDFLEDRFETGEADTVTVYVRGPLEADTALESIERAGTNPPDTFVTEADGSAVGTSIVTVIRAQAAADPEFAALVARNDRNGNGVPDRNLDAVYDALLRSPARGVALEYLTEDRRSARVVYQVEADADPAVVTADARTVAARFPYAATATGEVVVFQAVADLIFRSALVSLAVALGGTAVALAAVFRWLVGRPTLGLLALVPIVTTVALVAASMRAAGIALNAFTATVLALTIGLGVDYSVHVLHRFADERHEGAGLVDALTTTVTGTGGALAGSMLTTVFGIGVLVLAPFPAIGQFGLLAALSVFYAFLTSVLLLPSALTLRARYARPLTA